MREAAKVRRYGSVIPISGSDFVREVSQAPPDVWVVVILFKDGYPECGILLQCLEELATRYPATKFVKIISTDCIPNYPDRNLPTLLVYNNGAVKANYVGLHSFGRRCTPEGVAFVLCQSDPVLNDGQAGERHPPGSYEKARMRFAHAETLLPFSCLIGLFLEGSEFEKIQKEQPLELPPKPPQRRKWRGSIVAPFAGNNMLVLYSCPAQSSSNYFVQVLHNEHPIPMPGCDNSDFCPLEIFKERIVAPHLKHDFNAMCNLRGAEQPEQKPPTSKLLQIFRWFFPLGSDNTLTAKEL